MTKHTPTAVDFDDFMSNLTAEQAAIIGRNAPPGFQDQLHAAMDESFTLIETAEQASVAAVPRTHVDDWIRLPLLDTFITWVTGKAKTCMHAPDVSRPEPVWSCAWRPHLVVCTRCLFLLNVTGDADKICDGCGHSCVGVDNGDPIFTVTVWLGALAYQAGACTHCHETLTHREGIEMT
jgi:hypothetical protein